MDRKWNSCEVLRKLLSNVSGPETVFLEEIYECVSLVTNLSYTFYITSGVGDRNGCCNNVMGED